MRFAPYENESDAIEIAGLKLENRVDRVSVYGALDITRDKAGLDAARALRDVLSRIVAALEGDAHLPEQVAAPEETKTVKNPFA